MGFSSFAELHAALAQASGKEAPGLDLAEDGSASCAVNMNDVTVHIYAPAQARMALFVIELGPAPEANELDSWHALMKANFMLLDRDAPCFSRRPVTGEVLLQCAYPFDQSGPDDLLARISGMAQMARRWRRDRFMPEGNQATGRQDQAPGFFGQLA